MEEAMVQGEKMTDTSDATELKTAQQSTKPEDRIYSMNEEIEVDYLTYEITKAESFSEMGNSFMEKRTEGKFVKVYMKIRNEAKESKYIFTPRFYIIDDQGRKYDR